MTAPHALAAAAVVAALTGAGGGDAPVRLRVAYAAGPGQPSRVAHLRCTGDRSSADGFLRPIAARACAHARGIAAFLAGRPDAHRACTQIYGGPERARITGTVGGRRVNRTITRTDGCGIADWRRAQPLLPRPRGGP